MYADERRVKQILTNILSNAMKFTSKGGITLKTKKKNKMAQITVKDTGLGIKPESIPKLFNEFCMLSEHQAINPNGTGLGLYLSKKFAKLMNGSITVKSKYGTGTKFTLKLPLAKTQRATKKRVRILEDSKAAKGPRKSKNELKEDIVVDSLDSENRLRTTMPIGRKVLVVDDNSINLFIITQMVSKHSVNVDQASNGREALDLIKQHAFRDPYALVLMDIHMPVMSGPEVDFVAILGCCQAEGNGCQQGGSLHARDRAIWRRAGQN